MAMAETAPVLDKTKTATLTNLAVKSKEKAKKISNKNVLFQGELKWPRPSTEVEENILSLLSVALKKSDIFSDIKKKPGNEESKALKAKTRSQLDIGVSCVFRGLEKDALSCVLVSGQAKPAMAVEHLIGLARERGCPLLCLDQLATSVAMATDSKCLPLAIGFKHLPDTPDSAFQSVVALIKECAPVQRPVEKNGVTADHLVKASKIVAVKKDTPRPLSLTEEGERQILDEIHRALSKASTPHKVPQRKKKRKKKKVKRNLKDGLTKSCGVQFELGKRTVQDIMGMGKIQLVLVSDTVKDVLVTEAASKATGPSCLLRLAALQRCPVLCVTGLTSKLRPVLEGGVTVVGIKKLSTVPSGTERHFEQLIQLAGEILKSQLVQDKPAEAKVLGSEATTQNVHTGAALRAAKSKTPRYEEEDYSYLYVMKKDSKELQERVRKRKAEMEAKENEMRFSSDFISFGNSGGKQAPSDPVSKEFSRKKRKKNKRNTVEEENLSSTSNELNSADISTQGLTGGGSLGRLGFVLDRGGSDRVSEGLGFTMDHSGRSDQRQMSVGSDLNRNRSETHTNSSIQRDGSEQSNFTLDRSGTSTKSSYQKDVSDGSSTNSSSQKDVSDKSGFTLDRSGADSSRTQQCESDTKTSSVQHKTSVPSLEQSNIEIEDDCDTSLLETDCSIGSIGNLRTEESDGMSDMDQETQLVSCLSNESGIEGKNGNVNLAEQQNVDKQSGESEMCSKYDSKNNEGGITGAVTITDGIVGEDMGDVEMQQQQLSKEVAATSTDSKMSDQESSVSDLIESFHPLFTTDKGNRSKLGDSCDKPFDVSDGTEEADLSLSKTDPIGKGKSSATEKSADSSSGNQANKFLIDRGPKSTTGSLTSAHFQIDRGGGKKAKGARNRASGQQSAWVMGDLDPTATTSRSETGVNVMAMHQPATKGKKRKLQGEEGFISFAYTEANIHTMVANPSKKKRKKKKKK